MPIHGSSPKVSVAVVTKIGDQLAVQLPLEPGGYEAHAPGDRGPDGGERFQGTPFVLRTEPAGTWIVYAVTAGGRLAEYDYRDDTWHTDFPTNNEDPGVAFAGSVAVLRGATSQAREVFGITAQGRLVRVLIDGRKRVVDYPAEIAEGAGDRRFAGSPAAVDFDVANRKRLVYAVTTDGLLVELWGDGDSWQLGFPADEVQEARALRFRGSPAARLARRGHDDAGKHVAAIATDGRLVALSETRGIRRSAYVGDPATRIGGERVALVTAAPDRKGYVLVAITTEGRLLCLDDSGRTAEPSTSAECPESAFQGDPVALFADERIYVHAITKSGVLVQLRSGKADDTSIFQLPPWDWSYLTVGRWSHPEEEQGDEDNPWAGYD
jgi:hypothetical protein